MSVAIVTGSGGLIGSATSRELLSEGYRVIGIDNDMRAEFFGTDASTRAVTDALIAESDAFQWVDVDIRDGDRIASIVEAESKDLELIVHAAAQPSHDWAASAPQVDFGINANGTLNLLEAVRVHKPDATFVYLSTNKVYGDRPNSLPLVEDATRLELPTDHDYYNGIDTTMSIDMCTHSVFGVSKAAADLMVQEYGRYFDMPTVCFRGGCLTGPAHAGAKLHGFLSFLVKSVVNEEPYTVIGYGGKQVRDNIHASDVCAAILAFHGDPRPAAVYNLGGGRASNCSVLEAAEIAGRLSGKEPRLRFSEEPRVGDHKWWISDLTAFQNDYPDWRLAYGIEETIQEIVDASAG